MRIMRPPLLLRSATGFVPVSGLACAEVRHLKVCSSMHPIFYVALEDVRKRWCNTLRRVESEQWLNEVGCHSDVMCNLFVKKKLHPDASYFSCVNSQAFFFLFFFFCTSAAYTAAFFGRGFEAGGPLYAIPHSSRMRKYLRMCNCILANLLARHWRLTLS